MPHPLASCVLLSSCCCTRAGAALLQVLLEGRTKLEGIVRSRGKAAAAAGDHADVLRYTRLTRPLRLQQEVSARGGGDAES